MLPGNITAQFQGFEKFMSNFPGRRERRTLPVSEARVLLEESAAETMFPPEFIAKEAVRVTEQDGIVFIDEIDKIVEPRGVIRHGEGGGEQGRAEGGGGGGGKGEEGRIRGGKRGGKGVWAT